MLPSPFGDTSSKARSVSLWATEPRGRLCLPRSQRALSRQAPRRRRRFDGSGSAELGSVAPGASISVEVERIGRASVSACARACLPAKRGCWQSRTDREPERRGEREESHPRGRATPALTLPADTRGPRRGRRHAPTPGEYWRSSALTQSAASCFLESSLPQDWSGTHLTAFRSSWGARGAPGWQRACAPPRFSTPVQIRPSSQQISRALNRLGFTCSFPPRCYKAARWRACARAVLMRCPSCAVQARALADIDISRVIVK